MSTKRLKGLLPRLAAGAARPESDWESEVPPVHYVVGPLGTDVTGYVPSMNIMATVTGGSTGTIAAAIENPFSVACIIQSMTLYTTAVGAAGSELRIGIVASSGAAGTNITGSTEFGITSTASGITPIVAGGETTLWAANGSTANAWVTAQVHGGASTGLAGFLVIQALPLFAA